MTPDRTTFETLRDKISDVEPAQRADERRVHWVDSDRLLAFSRNERGKLEIFLVGGPLSAQEPTVKAQLVPNVWCNSDGQPLTADRLVLPEGAHFNAAAATVLVELLHKGYHEDPHDAFRQTEKLIALLLTAGSPEGATTTGLAGELLTIMLLSRHGDGLPLTTVLEGWYGWQPSTRDFQLGTVGIEVKTSTTGASRHHVQGWYQVEPGVSATGQPETTLFLLSLGITWQDRNVPGRSIESLVQCLLGQLSAEQGAAFLEDVRHYGGASFPIDDQGVAGDNALRRPFTPVFERLYDLSDERIQLPHSRDLAQFSNVVSDSVSFEIELPSQVRGDRNPVVGQAAVARAVRRATGR